MLKYWAELVNKYELIYYNDKLLLKLFCLGGFLLYLLRALNF